MSLPSALRITLPELPASYRPKDAAAMTRLSRPKIAAAIKKGQLIALRVDGCILIPKASLQTWLDERAVPWGAK